MQFQVLALQIAFWRRWKKCWICGGLQFPLFFEGQNRQYNKTMCGEIAHLMDRCFVLHTYIWVKPCCPPRWNAQRYSKMHHIAGSNCWLHTYIVARRLQILLKGHHVVAQNLNKTRKKRYFLLRSHFPFPFNPRDKDSFSSSLSLLSRHWSMSKEEKIETSIPERKRQQQICALWVRYMHTQKKIKANFYAKTWPKCLVFFLIIVCHLRHSYIAGFEVCK